MTNFAELEIAAVHPSPFQPRKTFDARKLQELADSIGPPEPRDGQPAGPGVLSPIVVRKNKDGHEIVFGERRWRASQIVGRTTIPALVVDMTDVAVMEAQLIENSQRENISVIEEAEHYDLLIKKHKHTTDTIAAKTGKSRSHIYARLGLLKLGPVAKKALADGRLQPAIATDLVVTVADPKLQEQYVRECLGENLNYKEVSALEDLGIAHEAVSEEDEEGPTFVDHNADAKPLSYRAARELLRRKYATKLALAKFDIHDATLTKAGACGPCPFRSGNQLDLHGIGAKQSDDVCTKPSCFAEKTQATWKIQAKDAETRGLKIVESDDAKNVFFDSGDIKPTSPYVDPNDDLPADLARAGSKASWSKLLAKRLVEIPRALVQDITGAPRELLVKSKAVEVLRELGKIDKPEKPKKSTSSSSSSKSASPGAQEDFRREQEKRELENDQKERALKMVLVLAADGGRDLSDKKELAFWRLLAKWCLGDVHWDLDVVAERRDLDRTGLLVSSADKAKTVGEVRGLLAECIVAKLHDSYSKDEKELFADACKLLGADYDKALDQVKADDKAKAKLEAADAKMKEPAKKDDDKKKDAKPAKAKKAAKKKGGKK